MPFVRNSLQIIILPPTLEQRISADVLTELSSIFKERSWVVEGAQGSEVNGVIEGGFARFWTEQSEQPRLYANHQGG